MSQQIGEAFGGIGPRCLDSHRLRQAGPVDVRVADIHHVQRGAARIGAHIRKFTQQDLVFSV